MRFDVVVVGGGHAGVEAAAAAARRGARTALVTLDPAGIGAMSCNPAIGGVGKGHIVREVDALDGFIARAADASAIHHRLLNRSKGSAVQGPRIQADRRRFAAAIQALVAAQPNLTVVRGEVDGLAIDRGVLAGLRFSDGTTLHAGAAVLATGTFLGGRLFRGAEVSEGGRIGERAPSALGRQLVALGLTTGRMKTGTPPRLDGRTIDWGRLAEQPSDPQPWTMSSLSRGRRLPQLSCAITRTTAATHDVIRAGLDRSPLRSGAITGDGPRYCPSIEDKVCRFGDRDGHQLFLEPEGLDTPLVYPNGVSTSLPSDVQAAMIATVPGLERARIVVPGYAVEYAHVDPRLLDHTLTVADLPGLFCAGQINGTTGYEEAAGQGLVAGANAAAYALGSASLLLDRASSYLGVMIDDLVLQGVTEPYRMLTARAEYRLQLRADNAETRVGEVGRTLGLLSDARQRHQNARVAARRDVERVLMVMVTAKELSAAGHDAEVDVGRQSIERWIGIGVDPRVFAPWFGGLDDAVLSETLEDRRYAPYVQRQQIEVAALRRADGQLLPKELDYAAIPGLSHEMVGRLTTVRPRSLGAAGRIRGITPAALTAILLHVERRAA